MGMFNWVKIYRKNECPFCDKEIGVDGEVFQTKYMVSQEEYLSCDVVDIAFDDCDVDLAKVNIKVKRIENSISRMEWNKSKKVC